MKAFMFENARTCSESQAPAGWKASQTSAIAVKGWSLHIRAKGESWRLAGETLGLDPLLPDASLLSKLEKRLALEPGSLRGHAVDRAADVVVVRPWAVWG